MGGSGVGVVMDAGKAMLYPMMVISRPLWATHI